MNRFLAMILLGLLLTGCASQGQTPTSDPFLVGRTRIPPPSTGSAAGQATTAPYYPSAQPSPQPAWQPSGTTTPPAATPAPSSSPTTIPATPLPGAAASPPGFTSKAPDGRSALSSSTSTPPAASSINSNASNRFAPATSSAGFSGVSLQGSRAASSAPDPGASPATNANRTGTALDNRIPRPLDDAAASGNVAAPRPNAGTSQPLPAKDNPPGRVMDLTDLPTAL
jgi:hypothetical protein